MENLDGEAELEASVAVEVVVGLGSCMEESSIATAMMVVADEAAAVMVEETTDELDEMALVVPESLVQLVVDMVVKVVRLDGLSLKLRVR